MSTEKKLEPGKREELVGGMMHELRRLVANSVLFNLRTADTLNMNPIDLQFINLLDINGPMTPGQLAQLSRLTTGGVTVALDRLEKLGAIRREPNPNDRRSSIVRVDRKFLRSAESAYAQMAEATNTLLRQFTDDDLAVVLNFLKRTNDTRP
jgi:DNA-binding MarR family transcriptional regulator